MNRIIPVLLMGLFLQSCNSETKSSSTEVQSTEAALHQTDFDSFLVKTFPELKALPSELKNKSLELVDFNLTNDRKLTVIVFETPETETFVLWEKKDGAYIKLLSFHGRGGKVQDVIEQDFDKDGMLDILLKSYSDAYGSYMDVFVNRSGNKEVRYERALKVDYIIPLVLDLDKDGTFEFIVANEETFPFGVSYLSFEFDEHRFIHDEKRLLEIQQGSLLKMDGKSDETVNTPLLVNYPIKIYHLKKYGLDDVTSKFPEFLALHIESVYYSNIAMEHKKNRRIGNVWKNFVLTYLDSYYQLATDSSYLKHVIARDEQLDKDFD